MWGTVVLMAVVVGVHPSEFASVAYLLSRRHASRLLAGYLIGGFGLSLVTGAVITLGLGHVSAGNSSSVVPPWVEVAVGVLALVAALLVGTGVSARMHHRRMAQHPSDHGGVKPTAAEKKWSGPATPPGFDKLPHRLQHALRSGSPWVAWAAGFSFGMPGAYYLAAIAAILKSGVGAGVQVLALLVYNLIAFAVAEIALVGLLVAPDGTRSRVASAHVWATDHHRVVLTALAGIAGVYLVMHGISKLE